MRKLALNDEILLSIQQPARYIGGEVNMCVKDPNKVDIRFAMCFPDVNGRRRKIQDIVVLNIIKQQYMDKIARD